ncbi:MAG: sigma 54-interacting transcriptional regulator, partial [Thermoanaerobaculia bacterium]|nr:sigma 54-interacting transcriptional regulator [Thermoanaerobaculia bacterium]
WTACSRGEPLALGRSEPSFAPPGSGLRRPLEDIFVSRRPVMLRPGKPRDSIVLDVRGSGNALVCDGRRVETEVELDGAALDRGVVLLLAERVVLLLGRVDPLGAGDLPSYGLVGESVAMVTLRRDIRRLAPLDVPVLLSGATGTGKELVAMALHEAGPRRAGPFLAVDMGAIPPTLAAAELFGAVRGAFTGAEQARTGLFRRADGGTLFLDEIGETPAEVQPLLLRALETSEIRPVGGDEARRIHVRVLAATDARLADEVAQGRFRGPLLHRLAGDELVVPTLAERREDWGRLFRHFFVAELAALGTSEHLAGEAGGRPVLPAGLVARLAILDWPGNVRQLKNVARRLAVAVRDGDPDRPWAELERLEQALRPVASASAASRPAYREASELTREDIEAALAAEEGRVQRAARVLGVARTSLYGRMKDLGIEPRGPNR